MSDEPLFRVIDESEFLAEETTPRKTRTPRSANTDDRTQRGWYKLAHPQHGFCTVPRHEEIQKTLNEEQIEFRDKYPVRMLYPIGDYLVCKDCYLARADLDE